MEGLYERPKDAAALDAYARGAVGRAEFMRRVRDRSRRSAVKWLPVVLGRHEV
jgi:hypothetical protein